ncbi:MAG: winged helix-turn-helix domain-containing protein [Terracidiphilus sp.]|jgi:DNA-binding winged helix-turn-helix (wHTH) protein
MTELAPGRRYRFGVFEADVETGELRRKGVHIKLNTQPFQVLAMLLERPGQVLTREEISRELWPNGVFVDAEHGVNSAVNRIREALGDSAGNPRFVETISRRGYRFIAPVERIVPTRIDPAEFTPGNLPAVPEENPAPSANQPTIHAEAEPNLVSRVLASPDELPQASHRVVQTLFVLLQLMYVAFYFGALTNLAEIEDLFSPLPKPALALKVLIVTAAILIPARAFILTTTLFYAPGARSNFLRIWPALLAFDELWALSPFLLLHHINYGLALACTTLLVYSPFAQRSLVLMGAGTNSRQFATPPSPSVP